MSTSFRVIGAELHRDLVLLLFLEAAHVRGNVWPDQGGGTAQTTGSVAKTPQLHGHFRALDGGSLAVFLLAIQPPFAQAHFEIVNYNKYEQRGFHSSHPTPTPG
jgi:hypothetical protein